MPRVDAALNQADKSAPAPQSGQPLSRGQQVLIALVVTVLVVATGLAQGVLTDRWGTPAAVGDAAARLNDIPLQIGGWTGQRHSVTPRMIEAAGAENIVDLEYHSPRGDTLRLMLVCGRSGPVSRHPPNVCFPSAGFQQVSDVDSEKVLVPGVNEGATFATCHFAREASRFLTRWSFSPDGEHWSVPSDPRFAFATKPWLYKLYLNSPDTNDAGLLPDRTAFLADFLHELRRVLNPVEPKAGSTTDRATSPSHG